MNCARQKQVNERIIEPKSKPKGTVLYTIWTVIDKVTLKQMNKGRIDARVNNRKALKLKAGFHRYDRCNHWKQRSAIVAII